MKQRVDEDERKLGGKTVLQCYNGKQMLVFTPLLKFYIDQGLEVTNITRFIQYQPEYFSQPFMNTVTKMRIEATMDKCESKQLTAKVNLFSQYENNIQFSFLVIIVTVKCARTWRNIKTPSSFMMIINYPN